MANYRTDAERDQDGDRKPLGKPLVGATDTSDLTGNSRSIAETAGVDTDMSGDNRSINDTAGVGRRDLDDGGVAIGGRADDSRAAGSPLADDYSDAAGRRRTGTGSGRILGGDDDLDNFDGPGPQVMTAETLTGDVVTNSSGDDLGKIESIMLDVASGRIAYAVLSFGGFLGMGEKLFAIPWQALKLDADNHCFILDVDKEQLRNAPGFDKDNWPAMADQQWATQVHSYYGSRPYWE